MITITQSGNTAFNALDVDGNLLSSHSRQDKAIEAVVRAGGGRVVTGQTLRVTVQPCEEHVQPPEPALPGLLWGASITGNGDPARHEDVVGRPLPVRSTFFQWRHHADSGGWLFRTAREDTAVGRLPWVRTKTPPWAEVAAGSHDTRLAYLLDGLADLDGPAVLTLHHEPENNEGQDGTVADWLAMQRRVADLAANYPTVKFAANLMCWTFNTRSGRDPEQWWSGDVGWDWWTVNHYRASGGDPWDADQWQAYLSFIEDRDVVGGVGEWGVNGSGEIQAGQVRRFYEQARRRDDIAVLSYFDSNLNSTVDWRLDGLVLDEWRAILTEQPA